MSVLLLVRHGQASFGAADYDVLSDRGVDQAARLGRRLAPLGSSVRAVVSGSMLRQRDTARHLAAAAGIDLAPTVDAGWDEYDAADVVSRVPAREVTDNASFQALLDEALVRWTSGETDYAETWPAFRDRVAAALERSLALPGTTVVAASAGSIGVAAAHLLGLSDPGWARLARTAVNTGLTKVVSGRSGTTLVSLNDHAHLEAEPGLVTYR